MSRLVFRQPVVPSAKLVPALKTLQPTSSDPDTMQAFFKRQNCMYTRRSHLQNPTRLQPYLDQMTTAERKLLDDQRNGFENNFNAFRTHYGPLIERGEIAPITLAYINNHIGWGAFAASFIGAYTMIGEYVGLVYDTDDQSADNSHYATNYKPPKKYDPFMRRLRIGGHPFLVVDAKNWGNETRFLNHANYFNYTEDSTGHKKFTANVGLGYTFYQGAWHLVMIANRDIAAGEELRIDYGDNSLRGRSGVSRDVYELREGRVTRLADEVKQVLIMKRRERQALNYPLHPDLGDQGLWYRHPA